MTIKKYLGFGLSACSLLLLSACSDDSNDRVTAKKVTQTYELTLSNLTNNQPFSPLAISLHGADFNAWQLGEAASLGLEMLAEGGDTSAFLSDANIYATTAGTAPIFSGESASLEIQSMLSSDMYSDIKLTVATMLINTNDAFTGIHNLDISDLGLGDELSIVLPVYDSGTEGNNELNGSIPGPADNGEGFNAARNDVNFVAMHPGVVTNIDGYSDSVLDSTHRFDSPAAKLVIKRTQ